MQWNRTWLKRFLKLVNRIDISNSYIPTDGTITIRQTINNVIHIFPTSVECSFVFSNQRSRKCQDIVLRYAVLRETTIRLKTAYADCKAFFSYNPTQTFSKPKNWCYTQRTNYANHIISRKHERNIEASRKTSHFRCSIEENFLKHKDQSSPPFLQ